MNKFSYLGLIAIFFCAAMMQSCQKENDLLSQNSLAEKPTDSGNITSVPSNSSNTNAVPCGEATVVDFFAGQHIEAGNVSIENTSTDLIITLTTTGGWVMGHTHLYVGTQAGLPTTGNGNPQIGHFPYSDSHSPMLTTYSWTIPLAGLDECFIVALHAEVHLLDANGDIIQSETAWGNGPQINNGGSWATFTDYCQQECCNSPITTETYNIYGGQTIPVGELSVVNDADFLYVTWTLDACWELNETHLYVGDPANIPVSGGGAPIPGQFPHQTSYNGGVTTHTYTIPLANLPACYAIAAHASTSELCETAGSQQETAWSEGVEFPNTNRWGWYSEYCTQEGCN